MKKINKKKVTKKNKNTKNIKNIKKPKKNITKKKTPKKIIHKKPVKQKSKKKLFKKTVKPVKAYKRLSELTINQSIIKPYSIKSNERYMNETQLEHFRNILLHWKKQLISEVGRTVQQMQREVSNYPDPIDRASHEEEFSFELRSRDRERKLLKKIEEALIRISENEYGYCEDCGTEIGIRRLEARPTATQCIECKAVSELKEKQLGEIIS